jgi:hypothetical protein
MIFLQVERICINHTIKTKGEKLLNKMKQKDQIPEEFTSDGAGT